MTSEKDEGSEERSDDLLAAEYVLGVLTSSERQIASSRMSSDPVFAQLVQDWEVQLAPLAAAYAEFEPPTSIKTQLDRQLVAMVDTSPAQPQSGLWSSLAFWRGLAAATVAAQEIGRAEGGQSLTAGGVKQLGIEVEQGAARRSFVFDSANAVFGTNGSANWQRAVQREALFAM